MAIFIKPFEKHQALLGIMWFYPLGKKSAEEKGENDHSN
jgi:hypothetical protein